MVPVAVDEHWHCHLNDPEHLQSKTVTTVLPLCHVHILHAILLVLDLVSCQSVPEAF